MTDPIEQQTFTVAYDIGDGDVVVNNFGITEAIKVRQGMIDQAVRSAAIAELERLGYRVLAPDQWDDACGLCFPGDPCKEHSGR